MAISRITLATAKPSNALNTLLRSAAITALAALAALTGMTGVASAAPQLFTATATVQNAVTLSQTTPLSFGTVFATKSASIATAAITSSDKLTLSTAGAITRTAATTGTPPPVLSLVAGTAGVYTAPGLPANATVKVTITNVTGDVITNSADTANASCMFDTTAAAITATTGLKIVLAHSAGDPLTGFFCVDAFTSDRAGLLGTGVAQGTGGAGYALGFGVTTLTFNLGATLVQQSPLTDSMQRTYEAGVYSGTVGMEVTFP